MKNSFTFIIIQLVIIVLWLIGWNLIESFVPFENVGAFGDQFGVLTSLFSAMAFGGIIYSMIIQTKELHLTREEFTKSSKSQTISNNALVAQLEIQQIVAIISGLTLLLEQYEKHEYLKKIDFGSEGQYAIERKKNIDQLNTILNKLLTNANIEGK